MHQLVWKETAMSQQENSKTRPYLMNDGKQSIKYIIIVLNSTMIIATNQKSH